MPPEPDTTAMKVWGGIHAESMMLVSTSNVIRRSSFEQGSLDMPREAGCSVVANLNDNES